MVYNTRNYWVFGRCPSSGILKIREHNISETGSVSVLRWGGGGEDTYSVSETLCSLIFRIPNDGQRPITQ
jgi:hypothetical protein